MKFILGVIAVILVLGIAGFLLPSIIGIMIGVGMIKSGSLIGGLLVIVIGVFINIALLYGGFSESETSSGYHDEECPCCGSGDTDGNHCFSCDDNF